MPSVCLGRAMNCRHLFALSAVALISHVAATRGQDIAATRDDATRVDLGASLYTLGSQWETQDGTSLRLSSFAGVPIVAALGSTICKSSDKPIIAEIIWIEKHLLPEEADRVRFVLFSTDWEADTPERLKLYAESHDLDPNRWKLLRGDSGALRELAAALNVQLRQGGSDFLNLPDHPGMITLFDQKGEQILQVRVNQNSSAILLEKLKSLLSKSN